MYGNDRDVRHNLKLFFLDGVVFTPSTALISITTVIPYFLADIGASTFQVALTVSMSLICNFISKPLFGSMASRARVMHKTFGKILMTQRLFFLLFVMSMPLFANNGATLAWIFLFVWGVFNFFVGSYDVFYTSLVIQLLPPNRRGSVRGAGSAIGSLLGVGVSAVIPVMMHNLVFPYNYMLIFFIGTLFLLTDVCIFLGMRKNDAAEPRVPMDFTQYLRGMPSAVRESAPFRAMIMTCMVLVVANNLLSYYTLYAKQVFFATESHVAALTASAVIAGVVGNIGFGAVTDRWGPKTTLVIVAFLVMAAGGVALLTHSLFFLFVAWVLANLANNGYMITASLLLGEVSPGAKLPLYIGVLTVISLMLSSLTLLLLAPALEKVGFMPLFATVFLCGFVSLLSNRLLLQRRS